MTNDDERRFVESAEPAFDAADAASLVRGATLGGAASMRGGAADEGLDDPREGAAASTSGRRVLVSNSKKPLFHYVRLAEKCLEKDDTVVLSGIGAAIGAVASVSEILRARGLATVQRVRTDTVELGGDDLEPDARREKARMEMVLTRSERHGDVVAANRAAAKDAADDEIARAANLRTLLPRR